ncbi:DNA polymerase III, delta subunit [Corynebacterium epidermidicanis]|uniref:DNA-directed DNA polymerase n=1 Tax=Corynebacterium epidermidicanis TaxID=1050174 RepID=A0A0G3GTA0_9CORY|nr:DNA polymerase III, delta subunit [Corynebacterium epidermidicanis]
MHLILGEESLLAERAQKQILDALRVELPVGEQLQVTTLRAGQVSPADLIDLFSPSLFSDARAVIFTDAGESGKEPLDLLMKACLDVAPGITVIIHHNGKGRQKAAVSKLKKLGHVHEVPKLNARDRQGFVSNEFRQLGVRVTPDVVHALLEGVGSDLRELASAVSQLVADTNGQVTVEAVRRYYEGVAEVSGFDIADLAVSGQLARAVASTRRALQLGTSPVAIAAALSNSVISIARAYGIRGAGNEYELAKTLGVPPFKVRSVLATARRWNGDSVSDAVILMAELDASTKGRGGDQEFAIEDAVRRIAELAGR